MIPNNNIRKDRIEIQVITNVASLIELEGEWDHLASVSRKASFYSSFVFVRTAWEHFNNTKRDRLFVLVARRSSEPIAIVPLRVETQKKHGIARRVIRMIPEWNGDRPGLVTSEDENSVWEMILTFLKHEYKDWDMLNLAELEQSYSALKHKNINKLIYHSTIEPETVGYYIKNCGWDDYQKTLSRTTKNNLKRKNRKLTQLSSKIVFECYRHADDIRDAIDRFIAIEQSGWKKGKPFAVGGNKIQREFYQELLSRIVKRKMVSIYFLRFDGEDLAAEIVFHYNGTSYLAHIAYNEKFAIYSPGVVLENRVIEDLIKNNQCREIDMLGMQSIYGKQELKKSFASHSRRTYRVRVQKRNMRWLLTAVKEPLSRIRQKTCSVYTGEKNIDCLECLTPFNP